MPDEEDTLALGEFVGHVELRAIECTECGALNSAYPPTHGGDEVSEMSASPRFELKVHTPDDEVAATSFLVEIRVSVAFPEGGAAAAYRAVYGHTAPGPPSIELLTDFTNNVALMTLLPYLREALADATRRVFGQPLLMPMFQRGQLTFRVPERQN